MAPALLLAVLLQNQFAQIAEQAHGRVGAAALLIETGESVALNPLERYPMQSVYKFPIAMAVLHDVAEGKLRLDQAIPIRKEDYVGPGQHSPLRDKYPQGGVSISLKELLDYNVAESDGSACDILLRLIGGPERADAFVRSLGIKDLVIANTEKDIGADVSVQYRNYATPAAAVQLLKAFHEGRVLPPASQELLRGMMIHTGTGLHRLKGNLPRGIEVAHKTGTSGTSEGLTHATNDIGIVTLPDERHLAIAVFVSDSRASEETREGVIAAIARAAWDHWVGQEGPRSK